MEFKLCANPSDTPEKLGFWKWNPWELCEVKISVEWDLYFEFHIVLGKTLQALTSKQQIWNEWPGTLIFQTLAAHAGHKDTLDWSLEVELPQVEGKQKRWALQTVCHSMSTLYFYLAHNTLELHRSCFQLIPDLPCSCRPVWGLMQIMWLESCSCKSQEMPCTETTHVNSIHWCLCWPCNKIKDTEIKLNGKGPLLLLSIQSGFQ